MISVGLIKELRFISKVSNKKVSVILFVDIDSPGTYPLNITINEDVLCVSYASDYIWKEDVSDDGFFGIESCDTISRIIACIDNLDSSWHQKYPSPIKLS